MLRWILLRNNDDHDVVGFIACCCLYRKWQMEAQKNKRQQPPARYKKSVAFGLSKKNQWRRAANKSAKKHNAAN